MSLPSWNCWPICFRACGEGQEGQLPGGELLRLIQGTTEQPDMLREGGWMGAEAPVDTCSLCCLCSVRQHVSSAGNNLRPPGMLPQAGAWRETLGYNADLHVLIRIRMYRRL